MTSTFAVKPGAVVAWQGKKVTITALVDTRFVLVKPFGSASIEKVTIASLMRLESLEEAKLQSKADALPDLMMIDDQTWSALETRFEAIKPLMDLKTRSRKDVEARAEKVEKGTSTLYKWLDRMEQTGDLSALQRKPRKDKGVSRFSKELEDYIADLIDEWKKPSKEEKRSSIAKAVLDIQTACFIKGFEPQPHVLSIRKRLYERAHEQIVERSLGRKRAKAKLQQSFGAFAEPKWPLQHTAIDHTPMDIMVVDQKTRRSIGRPYISVVQDILTRMVLGFWISLDPPSSHSVGMALAHAILPKETWCAKHKTINSWDVYGVPAMIQLDNAREFHGKLLDRACQQYNINLRYRRKGEADDSPHIERLIGTAMKMLHDLDGTTFSNTLERGSYDSEGNAIMTLDELETYVTRWIVDVYHQREHSSLEISPSEKYTQALIGDEDTRGIGLPERIADEKRLRLDFTPEFERTVTRNGIKIDNLQYGHAVLSAYVRSKHKQVFRRDPRYLNIIYFWSDRDKTYYPIPLKRARSDINIWQLNEARNHLKSKRLRITEENLFRAYDQLNQLAKAARDETAKVKKESKVDRKNADKLRIAEERLRETGIKPAATSSTSGGIPRVGQQGAASNTDAPVRRERRIFETVMPKLDDLNKED